MVCKLFVGGISWDTNEESLRKYFETFGEVVEAYIMKDRSSGRARGFGFVVFVDPGVADRVVLMKHVIDGRTVEAKKAVPRDDHYVMSKNNITTTSSNHGGSPRPVHSKKIFVGGLASTVTESNFRNYFDQFGTITDLVVMYDHNTQRPRGFGFITYNSDEAVDNVLAKNFHELNGKTVEVKRAVPKEISPSSNCTQFGSHKLRLSALIPQGYNPSVIRSLGIGIGINKAGFSPTGRYGHEMNLNFKPNLTPSYELSSNVRSNFGYGQGLSSYNSHIPSLHGLSGSIVSPSIQNLWGNGHQKLPTNFSFINYEREKSSPKSFESIRTIWGSPDIFKPLGGRFGRNCGNDGVYGRSYRDSASHSTSSEADRLATLGHGAWNQIPDRNPASFLTAGYNTTDRQANSGIPT